MVINGEKQKMTNIIKQKNPTKTIDRVLCKIRIKLAVDAKLSSI
jgi:hypothetical protein